MERWKCISCTWFRREPLADHGVCLANPPSVVALNVQSTMGAPTVRIQAVNPPVKKDHTCRLWSSSVEAEEEWRKL